MLNVIEPTNHILYQNKIESLLSLFKIYQNFELSPKAQNETSFVVAEDKARGVYGGAVFFPQKVKELDKELSDHLSILENRTIWCTRLCFCAEQDDPFTTLEALELCKNFYVDLYKILSTLGETKGTNCLPMKLGLKDYHNSLTYGQWPYFTKLPPHEDYVYVLLTLADTQRECQTQHPQEKNEDEDLEMLSSSNTQSYFKGEDQ